MQQATTVTQKGQVTIPQHLRKEFGIQKGQKIKFEKHGQLSDAILMRPVKDFTEYIGTFKTNKKYDKEKARAAYIPDVVAGKI